MTTPTPRTTPPPDESATGEPEPPEETSTEDQPAVDQPPTAAVGWAPAMREVVLSVLEESPAPPGPDPVACPQSADRPPAAESEAARPKESPDCAPATAPPVAVSPTAEPSPGG